MIFLYNFFIQLYAAGIAVAALFNEKARLWSRGRSGIFSRLENAFAGNREKVVWVHCASLGEFEQGRPVIEAIKQQYPSYKVLLTFFSPSGYEVRKNYATVDWVFYLPLDTKSNALQFISIVKPSLVIFVKYEYWYNYLNIIKLKSIPAIIISTIFKSNGIFFKPYGALHRKMLLCFTHIFVQDANSLQLLSSLVANTTITVCGDTRFDRVVAIARQFSPLPAIEHWIANRPVIVAGSTWPEDEKQLKALIQNMELPYSLIIAPHEVNASHLNLLKILFPGCTLYSELEKEASASHTPVKKKDVLIIDNVGMLSRLYYYSTISYVGGGFNASGIHNTLEAAVYGKPVVFGANYHKFAEAAYLIKTGGGYSYTTENELFELIKIMSKSKSLLYASGQKAGEFVAANTGATEKIMEYLSQTFFSQWHRKD